MNRKSAIRTLAAALLLALGAGAASAAPPAAAPAPSPASTPATEAKPATPATSPAGRPEPLPAYEALDANRDGIVTLPEIDVYSRPLAHEIRHCDRDHDRIMSREEHVVCERRPMHAQVAAHDAGHHHAQGSQPKHHHHHLADAQPSKDSGGGTRR